LLAVLPHQVDWRQHVGGEARYGQQYGDSERESDSLAGQPADACPGQPAAGLPGIRVTDTTDLVGRPAIEVYMEPGPDDPPAAGHALYFSPVTFQQVGWATISAVNVSCPVLASYAVLATGYVSSDTRVPADTPTQLEPAHYSNSAPGCPTLVVRTPTGRRS
jgi:hypothetical protein